MTLETIFEDMKEGRLMTDCRVQTRENCRHASSSSTPRKVYIGPANQLDSIVVVRRICAREYLSQIRSFALSVNDVELTEE